MLIDMLMLKWTEGPMLRFRDVDDDAESDGDNEIGSGNDEEV